MKILSCGAGMQSTALALMACENAVKTGKYPLVPVYDLIAFCDLGKEPPWVMKQVEFINAACKQAGIRFEILRSPLYEDYLRDFGKKESCINSILDRWNGRKERKDDAKLHNGLQDRIDTKFCAVGTTWI